MGSNKMVEESFAAIEETQKALRNSIEQSMDLAAKSEKLIQKHRQELRKGSDSQPSSSQAAA